MSADRTSLVIQSRLRAVTLLQILDYMPRAYDASFDAGDDPTEVYDDPRGPSDAEATALNGLYLPECEDDGCVLEDIDPESLADAPLRRHADKAGKTSGEDDGDVQDYLPISEVGAEGEDSPGSTDSVIAESLRESVEATGQLTFEKTVEFVAETVHPGLGRLINIGFKIKELLDDAEAVASRGSPRNLHVPLFDVAGGLAVDLNVHLSGADGSRDDAPPVSGFLSPGGGGLFGGWELEVDRPVGSDRKETSVVEHVARPSTERAERARRHEPPASPVISYDLSLVKRQIKDPQRSAVVLREAALRLRTGLFARPEFIAEPVLVIYDPVAGLGMWLVNLDLADALAGQLISIEFQWRRTENVSAASQNEDQKVA
jgi:hypothetical protein